jgi:hypothetical protein
MQWSGAPMVNANGVTFTRLHRTERGLVVARQRLSRDRKPIDGHDGVHRRLIVRDAEGRVLKTRGFDRASFPVISQADGCHGQSRVWGPRGQLSARTCLDADERAAPDKKGICRTEYRYDGRGCTVAAVEFKPGSKVGSCNRRHRRHIYTVDHRCARLSRTCLNRKGARVACGLKMAAETRYTRDEAGRITSTRHFALDNQPGGDAACKAFEQRKTRDERGRLVRLSYHGPAGEPVDCHRTGYHGLLYERDDANRVARQRFVAVDGSPGTNLGCAVRHYQHDNYDHVVETRNHGPDGKLINVLGLSIKRYLYDEGHREFAKLLFDVSDKRARYTGCFTGQDCPAKTWHAVRVRRQANGKVTGNLYFDADGQLVANYDCNKKRCWGE